MQKHASSAEISCAFRPLYSKNAKLSAPEHTHRMSRQVKRSLFAQQHCSCAELEKRWDGCIVCRHRKDSPIRWVRGRGGGWLARFASVEASPSCSYDNIAVVKPGPYGGAAEAIPPLLAGVSWGWEAPLQEVGLLVWNGCVCMCACVHMCWLYEIKCDLFFRWKMKCTRGH